MQINIEKAHDLIQKYLEDKNNQIHSRESEVVMRAMAKELGEDEETWGIAGLLHDLDWEQTAEDWPNHGLKTMEILKEEDCEIPEEVAHAISAHNGEHTGVSRESKLDYALAAGESITGLIYAYALMRPEKLEGMKTSSLNKKFKDKSFAAKVSRELIADVEKTGLEKSKFFEISIKAIQDISSEIGL
jgi:uncharacterized protein